MIAWLAANRLTALIIAALLLLAVGGVGGWQAAMHVSNPRQPHQDRLPLIMPLTSEQLTQQILGEIRGELKAVIRQNENIQATGQTTQTLVQNLATEVAAIRATQTSQGERLNTLHARVDKTEDRIGKIEVVAAKHGAGFGALAAAGTALIVEGVRQWLGR